MAKSDESKKFGPRIERDGTSIKLIANENTYILIDQDKIVIMR